jgi:hypothetical protein
MLKLILLIVFVNLLSSCKLNVPDVPVCTEITPDRAFCTYTVSNKEFYWDDINLYEKKTYWESRQTMILVPSSSWSKIKAFVIKMCEKSGQCGPNPSDSITKNHDD